MRRYHEFAKLCQSILLYRQRENTCHAKKNLWVEDDIYFMQPFIDELNENSIEVLCASDASDGFKLYKERRGNFQQLYWIWQ